MEEEGWSDYRGVRRSYKHQQPRYTHPILDSHAFTFCRLPILKVAFPLLLLVGLGSGALDPFGDAEVEEPHPILGWFTLCNAFVKSGKIEKKA